MKQSKTLGLGLNFLVLLSIVLLPGCGDGAQSGVPVDAYTSVDTMPYDSVGSATTAAEPEDTVANEPNTPINSNSDKRMATPDMETMVTLQTEAGDIVIALSQQTPKTSANFVNLAKQKFYDGTIFHRTIPGFMIQGGDPTGTGGGGPGYRFDDEPFTGQYTRGTVAMANAGPNTNGSQFFIMHADYPLPPNYVIFGHVLSGMEAVDKIVEAPTQPGGEGSRPVQPMKIKSVVVEEKQ